VTAATHSTAQREALQARYALRVTSALDQLAVPHDIEQRLRVARDLAVAKSRAARTSPATASAAARDVSNMGMGQAALQGGPDKAPWWLGPLMVGMVITLVVGLFAIDYQNTQAQIEAAAEVDAALLADDLPPKAYSDAGFREFVRLPQE
jgi:hypothetical protein